MTKVSVIIVNYNTKELTYDCIKSIRELTAGCSYEIILVDNASTDGSREFFSEVEGVRYIYNNQNIGFGRANNLGVKYAAGKYLFFLNSDTILLNDAISMLCAFEDLCEGEKHFAVGCELLDNNLNHTHSGNPFPDVWRTLASFLHIHRRKENRNNHILIGGNEFFYIDYVTGADMLIRKEDFLSLNGFDPSFFMYYEETDLQKKASEQGFSNVILCGPKIVHLGSASFSKVKNFATFKKRYVIDKSMFLYFKKHLSYCKYFCFRLFFLLIRLPFLLDFRYKLSERIKYITLLFSYVPVSEKHSCK